MRPCTPARCGSPDAGAVGKLASRIHCIAAYHSGGVAGDVVGVERRFLFLFLRLYGQIDRTQFEYAVRLVAVETWIGVVQERSR